MYSLAQKTVYIPLYLLDKNTVDGKQFSMSKTLQSENFILIWGDSSGINPLKSRNPDLVFNPQKVLDTMESIYKAFVKFGFAQDDIGTKLHQYKIPIIMLNTFGETGVVGWAFGGDADGQIGAFWAHPLAMQTGHVAAHEFTHSLQAQAVLDYRNSKGLGIVWKNAGIFWETHANFMRNLLYPQDVTAWGMDVYHIEKWGDWKNTYENYEVLLAVMESDGIDIVNRLWRESMSNEYPLQAYKRLMNYNQIQFNTKMYDYVKRMTTFDFVYNNIGKYFRQYRKDDLLHWLPSVQACYTILKQDSLSSTHFTVPIEIAPEEFAYNIIPIHPDSNSCAVIIKFKGHLDAHIHAGWRYGFVSTHQDGSISRYGKMYSDVNTEIAYTLKSDEKGLYLVVMGAPGVITNDSSNDTWHGYPKHYRFPYELSILGGVPEGYQNSTDFRKQLKINGHLHSNGGGWIDNEATVSASVFVGPYAMVLGRSKISGNARIENTSLIKDATIEGNLIASDNAFIVGGNYKDNAVLRGQAFLENDTIWNNAIIGMRAKVSNYKLHGNIEVGGDVLVYNSSGDCTNGVYYRMTNYYEDNLLECDGRTKNHIANSDVNNVIQPFTSSEMKMNCNCTNYPACLTVGIDKLKPSKVEFLVYPNPVSDIVNFQFNSLKGFKKSVCLYTSFGRLLLSENTNNDLLGLDVSTLASGIYLAKLFVEGQESNVKLIIQH